MSFWKRKKTERVLFEDALKHIYNCEYYHLTATPLSVAGALRLKLKKVVRLIDSMGVRQLVRRSADAIHLTPQGRAWALQVIRAHRLWERYLSDEVGLPLSAIHDQAEKKEHQLTPEEADALEAELGYPLRDPHGDPIPSSAHTIPKEKTTPLTDWPHNQMARIAHIEDEPQEIFTQILSEGLLLDTCVKVLESDSRGFHLWTYEHGCWLAPAVAANISVVKAPLWVKETHGEPLTVLKPGESAKVVALKCYGLTKRRFMDLGLLPGTNIKAMMQSALVEPMAYKVREAMIALRREQAEQILIQR